VLSVFRITLFLPYFIVGFLRYACADDYILLKVLECGAGAG